MNDTTPKYLTKTVYVAYTNTDCTEGRGYDVPIAVCELRVTAKRLAERQYVQGTDGPVREMTLMMIGDKWYVPQAAVTIVAPTLEDIAEHERVTARMVIIERAKAARLSDDDIAILRGVHSG